MTARRTGDDHRLLLVHQFALPRVSGLTITVGELLRLIPEVDPDVSVSGLSYDRTADADDLCAQLDRDHRGVHGVVGLNLHIEVGWEHTLALARWCERRGIPLHLYAHDYWPQHRDGVALLTERFGARLLAITPAIVADLAADGFGAQLVPAGVAVPPAPAIGARRAPAPTPTGATVAALGRLVPRKRFADVVGAFCLASTPPRTELHLRLPPSLVFTPEQDRERLDEIQAEVDGCRRHKPVVVDPRPSAGTDYRPWAVYVSASEYEGVSMTPLESILQGCPFLLSDIAPHRDIATALFADRAGDFLFPVGDRQALAGLLDHELATGERRAEARARAGEIRAVVERRWSLRATARQLVDLSRRDATESSTSSAAAR